MTFSFAQPPATRADGWGWGVGVRATGGLGVQSHPGFGFATDFLETSLPLLGSHWLKEGQAGQDVLLGSFQR